jgi:hypothetical protein
MSEFSVWTSTSDFKIYENQRNRCHCNHQRVRRAREGTSVALAPHLKDLKRRQLEAVMAMPFHTNTTCQSSAPYLPQPPISMTCLCVWIGDYRLVRTLGARARKRGGEFCVCTMWLSLGQQLCRILKMRWAFCKDCREIAHFCARI